MLYYDPTSAWPPPIFYCELIIRYCHYPTLYYGHLT